MVLPICYLLLSGRDLGISDCFDGLSWENLEEDQRTLEMGKETLEWGNQLKGRPLSGLTTEICDKNGTAHLDCNGCPVGLATRLNCLLTGVSTELHNQHQDQTNTGHRGRPKM